MANQNLNVELDLTMLNEGIKQGKLEISRWKDRDGREHASVLLFVHECSQPTDKKTHNVTAKEIGGWKNAKIIVGSEEKVLYCGKALPSKYQPDGSSSDGDVNESNNVATIQY